MVEDLRVSLNDLPAIRLAHVFRRRRLPTVVSRHCREVARPQRQDDCTRIAQWDARAHTNQPSNVIDCDGGVSPMKNSPAAGR